MYIFVFTQLMRNAPSPFPLFITVCSCRWCQPTNTSALKQKWCSACKQRFHPACGIIVPMRLTITKSDDHDRARIVFNAQIKHHIFVILTVLNNSISWLKLTQKNRQLSLGKSMETSSLVPVTSASQPPRTTARTGHRQRSRPPRRLRRNRWSVPSLG
jgi:hypothetical protein